MNEKMIRSKTYKIMEITEDGLIKDASNKWGDTISFGENSEEECWAVLERKARYEWDGFEYKFPIRYIVVCEWTVSAEA